MHNLHSVGTLFDMLRCIHHLRSSTLSRPLGHQNSTIPGDTQIKRSLEDLVEHQGLADVGREAVRTRWPQVNSSVQAPQAPGEATTMLSRMDGSPGLAWPTGL